MLQSVSSAATIDQSKLKQAVPLLRMLACRQSLMGSLKNMPCQRPWGLSPRNTDKQKALRSSEFSSQNSISVGSKLLVKLSPGHLTPLVTLDTHTFIHITKIITQISLKQYIKLDCLEQRPQFQSPIPQKGKQKQNENRQSKSLAFHGADQRQESMQETPCQ